MRDLDISLTGPQADFACAEDTYPAIVAGFGSGKTEALLNRLLLRKVSYPRGWVGYYAPSYDLVSKIFYPRIEELLTKHDLPYKLNKQEKTVAVRGYGTFIARTMDRPASIVGYEHADAGIDELDTLSKVHAADAWRKIIARNRQKKPYGANTVAVATTPEGFRFVYEKWGRELKEGYRLIRASTYSNAHNLPDDYISNLEKDYPPALLKAYLEGAFVNLTSGSVHPDFSRHLNACKTVMAPGEALHVGMDFNVLKMAAVAFVVRNDEPHAVAELTGVRDTPSMCDLIKASWQDKGRQITVYPDAAGNATSSKGASISDITQIRAAGLGVIVGGSNPRVKDRVASVNGLILNAAGQRRLHVNIDACPDFVRGLEQQVYDKNGEPDKTAGLDHPVDAGGYFLHKRWPIVTGMTRARLRGT